MTAPALQTGRARPAWVAAWLAVLGGLCLFVPAQHQRAIRHHRSSTQHVTPADEHHDLSNDDPINLRPRAQGPARTHGVRLSRVGTAALLPPARPLTVHEPGRRMPAPAAPTASLLAANRPRGRAPPG